MFFDCKLFARNFHFKRLYCLNQYFLYLGGYLLTTGQIYGFSGTLPTVCSLSHINGKTPALFPGLFAQLGRFAFSIKSTLWAFNSIIIFTPVSTMRLFSHVLQYGLLQLQCFIPQTVFRYYLQTTNRQTLVFRPRNSCRDIGNRRLCRRRLYSIVR